MKSRFVVMLNSVLLVTLLSPNLSWGISYPDVISVGGDHIFRWNFNTTTDTYAKYTTLNSFGDMTRLNDGRILAYQTSYSGKVPALYEINPITGDGNLIVQSSSGAGKVVSMTWTRAGDLFAFDNSLGFLRINPATLQYSKISLSTSNSMRLLSGNMATSPAGDIYSWATGINGSNMTSMLYKIDLDAGTAMAIGGYENLSVSQNFNAMAFSPDGRLYGFTEINGGINGGPFKPNGIYELNLQTGMPTLLSQRNELTGMRGVAFVPEPSAIALLLTAASGGLLWWRRLA